MLYLATLNGSVQEALQKQEEVVMKKIVISILIVLAFSWISGVSADKGSDK